MGNLTNKNKPKIKEIYENGVKYTFNVYSSNETLISGLECFNLI
jgi:hypothetical protein